MNCNRPFAFQLVKFGWAQALLLRNAETIGLG